MAGEPAALQTVLEGLQEQAWAIARDFTHDWDEAEDLAQEILVEVARSLPALSDPEHLEGWCWTLGQRVCLAWKQRERRRQLLLGSLRVEEGREDPSVASRPFGTPEEGLLAEEQREGLKVALQKLSRQCRQVLELFYLDGLSLREIAVHLGVSENTVKQRLHGGRCSLRKEMETMPATAEARQRPAVKPLLEFSAGGIWEGIVGAPSPYNPWALTRPLLAQQILLQIAKTPKGVAELALAVGTEEIYVLDHLSSLEGAELVRPEEGDRYIADFFILDQGAQQVLRARSRELGQRDAQLIAAHVPEVRAAFDQCRFADQGFPWDSMRWLVLAVLLGNLGLHRMWPQVHHISYPLRPDGNRWFFCGRTCDVAPDLWPLLCSTSSEVVGGVGCFGSRAIPGKTASLPDPEQRKVIYALLDGPQPVEQVEKEAGAEAGRTKIAELLEVGIVVKEGGRLRLAVPVFTAAEDQVLCPVVDRICREVVARSRTPALQGLGDLLDALGFDHLKSQYLVMHGWMESAYLEPMIEMGLLGGVPKEVSGAWGHWAWKGSVRLMSREN
ncbi:MAG: sigma-70 family RNA polymerase sigma factor [Candidatus Latescibacteria bacterium]|nr:sigma-70 family RNA polymerase sigma factor [Candidatus Latescibacterota bacterium]